MDFFKLNQLNIKVSGLCAVSLKKNRIDDDDDDDDTRF